VDGFGRRVKELRRARGWTKRELAERAQMHDSYVGKVENGTLRRPPSAEVIRRMADALGVSEGELLRLAGRRNVEHLEEHIRLLEEVRDRARVLVGLYRQAEAESGELVPLHDEVMALRESILAVDRARGEV
jgi:transcriptional regulator with XRE-family HTH domain